MLSVTVCGRGHGGLGGRGEEAGTQPEQRPHWPKGHLAACLSALWPSHPKEPCLASFPHGGSHSAAGIPGPRNSRSWNCSHTQRTSQPPTGPSLLPSGESHLLTRQRSPHYSPPPVASPPHLQKLHTPASGSPWSQHKPPTPCWPPTCVPFAWDAVPQASSRPAPAPGPHPRGLFWPPQGVPGSPLGSPCPQHCSGVSSPHRPGAPAGPLAVAQAWVCPAGCSLAGCPWTKPLPSLRPPASCPGLEGRVGPQHIHREAPLRRPAAEAPSQPGSGEQTWLVCPAQRPAPREHFQARLLDTEPDGGAASPLPPAVGV